jgi:YHS domain-containing protein
MPVEREKAADQVLYQGQRYYFCSEPCAEQFEANPGRFVEGMKQVS